MVRLASLLRNWAVAALAAPIHFYRYFLSPLLPPSCRFEPTCSAYALEALERHGALKGSALTFWRVLRCNPWGGSGYDPVPPCNHKHPRGPHA